MRDVGAPLRMPTAQQDALRPVASLVREPTHDEIARRAYQLHEARGGDPGRDWEDWFQAERELRQSGTRDVIDANAGTRGPYAA
jgi:hypothetical protein